MKYLEYCENKVSISTERIKLSTIKYVEKSANVAATHLYNWNCFHAVCLQNRYTAKHTYMTLAYCVPRGMKNEATPVNAIRTNRRQKGCFRYLYSIANIDNKATE